MLCEYCISVLFRRQKTFEMNPPKKDSLFSFEVSEAGRIFSAVLHNYVTLGIRYAVKLFTNLLSLKIKMMLSLAMLK